MNELLVLDEKAPIYETERRKRDLPDQKIALAKDLEMAEPLVQGVEIIFARPALVAAPVNVFEREPLLPDDSPLWTVEIATITPTSSANCVADKVVGKFTFNDARYPASSPLDYLVDFKRDH